MPSPCLPRARHLAAAVAVAVGVGVGVAGCTVAGKDAPGGSPAPTTKPAVPTATASAYFVGRTPDGLRLFSERDSVSDHAGTDRVAALRVLLRAGPADPDYRSLLPRGSVDLGAPVGLRRSGQHATFTVTVGARRWTRRPHGMSRTEARLAVQQLLYTLGATTGDTRRARVDFRLGGHAVHLLGVPSGTLAAPPARTLALVNVLAPVEGTTVDGETLSASGLADSFEAHVPWQVLDGRGRQVLNGFTTAAGSGKRLYPWHASVDIGSLQPGRYTFLAKTAVPSGREGYEATTDTKTFVVP